MRITDAIRDRLDPTHSRFETGTEEDRQRARAQWRRDRFLSQLASSSLPELPLSDLAFRRFGRVESRADGRLFQLSRAEVVDAEYTPGAVAYFVDTSGVPWLLERPDGPESVQALAEEQADLELRRAQPRPRPAWMS